MSTAATPVRALAPVTADPSQIASPVLEERIRRRAHDIWLENGSPAGSEVVDWLKAEKEILEEQR